METVLVAVILLLSLVCNFYSTGYFAHYNSVYAYGVEKGYEQLPIIYNDQNLGAELVFKGLKLPTSMSFLGPNDIMVLEKNNGTVKRIVNGTLEPNPLLNVNVSTDGGRGMLGIKVAKNLNQGPTYVFLYYIEASKDKDEDARTGGKAMFYRYELNDNKLTNPKLLLDVSGPRGVGNTTAFHNGGKILIGPDKNVYLVVGEFSHRHTAAANYWEREPADGSSGIIRITQEGRSVKDGNIIGDSDPLNKYYAYGIRNSFGMDFDPVTGNLWDTENGPDFGDEINLVEPGFNSGYNIVQGTWFRDGLNAGDVAPRNPEGLVDFNGIGKYSPPEFSWYHTVAPTALIFLDSNKLGEQYRNDMFVSDISIGNIYHFKLNENRTGLILDGELGDRTANTDEENKNIIFGSGFKQITDMQVGPDGYLYILSHLYGAIFRVVPVESMVPKQSIVNLVDDSHVWQPFNKARVSQNDGSLFISVDTNETKKVYNRAYLPTKIDYVMNKTLLLNLNYSSESKLGNATFSAEIVEYPSNGAPGTKNILWSSILHNTSGKLTSETFILPENISNKPVELRLYITSENKGQHTLSIKNANIVH